MPIAHASRIARSPDGTDASIPERGHLDTHSFVGANAFLLELMADHAEELGVVTDPELLRENAQRTRRFLAERTAKLHVGATELTGSRLRFSLTVENLSGHKFPTGHQCAAPGSGCGSPTPWATWCSRRASTTRRGD